MKITMLGTGNALVTECYNTCFVIQDNELSMLVDGGGGSELLARLKKTNIQISQIHDIFVTHKHIDHIMGIVWIIRIIAQAMNKKAYDGTLRIYAHQELVALIRLLVENLLQSKQIKYLDERILLIPVNDNETKSIIGHDVTFFDIQSTKAKQFGFSMNLDDNRTLVCCGDEPCSPSSEHFVKNCDWLLHEAFCLYADKDQYKPYEKNHSTVKDACELAQRLNVKNLLLYHTEDDHISMRKSLYSAEGAQYFDGNLVVPNDLETIQL